MTNELTTEQENAILADSGPSDEDKIKLALALVKHSVAMIESVGNDDDTCFHAGRIERISYRMRMWAGIWSKRHTGRDD